MSKGKGGSHAHVFSREKGFFGGHGIVGAQVPIGTGLAFGQQATVATTAASPRPIWATARSNQGQVYESLQHGGALEAAGRSTSIENNRYAHGHLGEARPRRRPSCTKRGSGFNGIPGEQVDGMDVLRGARNPSRATSAPNGAVRARGRYILEMHDLSLSRPFDVRPGEIPDQGRSADQMRDRATTLSRRVKKRLVESKVRLDEDDDIKSIDARRAQGRGQRVRRIRAGTRPSPIRRNCGPTVLHGRLRYRARSLSQRSVGRRSSEAKRSRMKSLLSRPRRIHHRPTSLIKTRLGRSTRLPRAG